MIQVDRSADPGCRARKISQEDLVKSNAQPITHRHAPHYAGLIANATVLLNLPRSQPSTRMLLLCIWHSPSLPSNFDPMNLHLPSPSNISDSGENK